MEYIKLVSASLFLTACTSLPPQTESQVYPTEALARSIYSKEHEPKFFPCDFAWKDTAIEMTRTIDQIIRGQASFSTPTGQPKINIQLSTPNEIKEDYHTSKQKDVWRDSLWISWKTQDDLFNKMKENPSHEELEIFILDTTELLSLDNERIYLGRHPSVQRVAKDRAINAISAIENCLKIESCITLNMNAEADTWLREGPYQRDLLDQLSSAKMSIIEKRNLIQILSENLNSIKRRYQFKRNSAIRVDKNTLIVPLDLTAFGADISRIIDLLETPWKKRGLPIQVINEKGGYNVAIEDFGSTSYVDHTDKAMHLIRPLSHRTMIHEFGHILGLPDNYYPVFNPLSCSYFTELNRKDIMSSAIYGDILPEHITEIKSAYGLK